jgi:tetratricopeptide (TPR) repeat protein
VDSVEFDVFLSYARADDAGGWVSGLRDAIYADFREFSSEPFRIFFDTTEIHSREEWELRLRQGLRTSRVLLVCLSPNYLRSEYCRWEWEEFSRLAARRIGGGDPVTGVYFVELGGDEDYEAQVAAWRHQVERVQLEQLQPWFPDGVTALQNTEVRKRVTALGVGVADQVRQARLAKSAPGNLRRHNPLFVGRVAELRALRHQLTGGAVGVVTAVHGIGGVGKTELAVTYAHAYAHTYQGGTWQVDADGATDVLEAISALALSPELGLEVREEHLQDRPWLGRRVLARLGELTEAARARDAGSAACLVLLDNVSEPALLAEAQLAVLPDQPWFHLAVTTRLGVSDIGSAGSRASVAMIEVGRLATEDGLALIREHQPARDTARLLPDFTSPAEADAARRIVELLDGYTLAVEQAAVYLGSSGTPPSQLLEVLSAHGAAVLDDVGGSAEGAAAILHKDKLTAVIVDQTLQRLPQRGRDALALASLLPPDSIPWQWLQQLTEPPDPPSPPAVVRLPGLPGLPTADDWAATRRLLEGRRLLTPADDPQFARLHRVLGHHLRTRLVPPDTDQLLDTHLQNTVQQLKEAETPPDTALLAVTAATITSRLTAGRDDLAAAGLKLSRQVQSRLDLTTTYTLTTATLTSYQRLAEADPDNTEWQNDLGNSLVQTGHVLARQGDSTAALEHYTRALHIAERHTGTDPRNTEWQSDLGAVLGYIGDVLARHGDSASALEHYTRALHIGEALADTDPQNTRWQDELAASLNSVGDVLAGLGDTAAALEHYTRALHIAERHTDTDPHNTRWQLNLVGSLVSIGDVLAGRGDSASALEHYTRALHIAEALADTDPRNTRWQFEMVCSLNRIGVVLERQGDTAGAREHDTRALHILEALADTDPENTRWQNALAVSLIRVGGVLARQGDSTAALEHYTRALHIAERHTDTDPHNTQWQYELAAMLRRVGDVLARLGDTAAALEHYTRAVHIFERLTDTDPHTTQWQHELALSFDRVGSVLAGRGDTAGALARYTQSLHICERLADTDPRNIQWQRDLAVSAGNVATKLGSTGDPSAAEYWSRAHRILTALDAAGKLPDSDREFLDYVTGKVGPT